MKIYSIVFGVFGLFPCMMHAYIYELVVLKQWDPKHNRYHVFIGLSDFHDKTHPANKEQLTFIEQVLKNCNRTTTKVILEDLSSKGCNERGSCGPFLH